MTEKTFYHDGGKGDYRRKRDKDVSAESFESNWDRIFSKKAEEHCKACHGEGKVFDGGFFYDCTVCGGTLGMFKIAKSEK